MRDEFKKATAAIFAGYEENSARDEIKAEMTLALDDRFLELRKRGVIESAAIKKVLSELDRTVKNAERASGGSKQKRLNHVAEGLGVSPIGRRRALLRTMSVMLGLFGVMAAIAFWVARREPAGAVAAMLPFASTAAAAFTFVQLTRYRAGRSPLTKSKAIYAALLAGGVSAALLAALASTVA